MADTQSATAPASPKQLTIEQIADHIIETYQPFDAPVVLMWREVRNGFHLKLNADWPVWTRDDSRVHDDWNRYGRGVVKILEKRSTVVKVSAEVRDLVKHGHPPDRSGKRTDERYRACIPSSSSPTFGIAVFPRGQYEDHPLIVESRRRRAAASATGLTNAVASVRAANDMGNLSNETRDEVLGATRETAQKAFTDDRYPLFGEQGAPALPAPDSGPEA